MSHAINVDQILGVAPLSQLQPLAARAETAAPPLVAAERRVPRPCVHDDGAHCLGGDRFEIAVDWRTQAGETGFARTVDLTGDSGLFYFYQPIEDRGAAGAGHRRVKVLDACATASTASGCSRRGSPTSRCGSPSPTPRPAR